MDEDKCDENPAKQEGESSGDYQQASTMNACAGNLGYNDGMTPEQRVRMNIAQNIIYSFGQNGTIDNNALVERLNAIHSFVMGD